VKVIYTGIAEVTLNPEELAKFYESKLDIEQLGINLHQNEYLIIKNENFEYIDKYRFDGEKLVKLHYRAIDNVYINKLKPRNIKQECVFDLLQNDSIPVKLITGAMGSGKTWLSLHHALDKLDRPKTEYKKIVYIRNNVEVKDSMPLGALPNGVKDKLLPFIMPLVDCIGHMTGLEMLEKQEKIEYVHLGYIRGRNFSNSIVLVSESENLTKEHVKLLIGRIGENSIIIFEGDISQTDKKVFEGSNNGIFALREVLAGNKLFGAVDLDKSERSAVAELSNLF